MTRDSLTRTTIVTGAGSGIGAAVATTLSLRGGQVALLDRDVDAVERQAAAIGAGALAFGVDVRSAQDVRAAVDAAAEHFGGIDHLVGCAGVARYGTVVDLDEADWDLQIDTNLKGAFLLAKYGIPHLRQRGRGSIVYVSSAQAFASQQLVSAYAASKGGLVSLTKTIALDHAAEGIRCNAVCPGSIDTAMLRAGAAQFGGDDIAGTLEQWGHNHPLGFVGEGSDVAAAVAFLLSDDARFITGTALPVDGGLLAKLAV